ncbi:MAG: mechanosensitive ion channel family protein, partial [Geminicoccaceae bacterium]
MIGTGVVRALLGLWLVFTCVPGTHAEDTNAAAIPPAKVRELLNLLDDPSVRDWLAQQRDAKPPLTEPTGAARSQSMTDMTAPAMAIRQHVVNSLAAIPTALPELHRTLSSLAQEIAAEGVWFAVFLVGLFLGLGWVVERIYWRVTGDFRRRLIAMDLDSVEKRLGAVGRRLLYGLGWTASFAVGSLGAFLVLAWPPLLHALISRLLLVVVLAWLTTIMLRFILAPGAEKFRILPMPTRSARHWYLWLTLAVVWYLAGHLLLDFLRQLGLAPAVMALLQDGLSLVWLGILLLSIWSRPGAVDATGHSGATLRNTVITCALVAVWLLVPLGAHQLFYTIAILASLAALLVITHRSVAHILRPPDMHVAEDVPPVAAVVLERGLRALWIIGAAVVLIEVWGVDVTTMAGDATMTSRLLRGVLHAVVIVLLAELAWQLSRSWIDRTLIQTAEADAASTPEAEHRRSRIRTLLPIARNMLFVVLTVMAALMALSALGVEVGPLIAGAGVVGVAIGFGSQTLVKDVISGVFFLLDDAFRVGEYIISGSYKGTVESFSLRSIKLRHHRGYLYTVPFGSLGAIQNMSRDWVIDKQQLTVPYDTNLDLLKKIIKQIGKDLAADPELAPSIIEPLKMQGVEGMGEMGMLVRLKMMTKPGQQFAVRRRANSMLKQRLAENGIRIATPTVQVASG